MKFEEVTPAIEQETPVTYLIGGVECVYRVQGVISRYSKIRGWYYVLELMDKSGCIAIAKIDEVKIRRDT